ncbi:hypothetical protein RHSIM_Rhsim12G0108800 [Rhododendron simsii]|uniref:Uncharacterized protein n=1 Tax=Rhododendron simsii TaxID=118357 RepID=A0A834L8Y2_RHOSS|nr:hypothetical protein RHSIM_Rhsim12G0108800 [Rhododendron simsii]
MSKSWGKIGAWAADAEAEEAAQKAAAAAAGPSFPSLKEATSSKQPKKKKMSLQEFTMQQQQQQTSTVRPTASSTVLTPAELLRLPTSPSNWSAEGKTDYRQRLGGGFSNYDGRDREPSADRDAPRKSSYGGFHDNRSGAQPSSRVSDFDQPSRADEVDNWATEKKTLPSSTNRYSSLGGGVGGGMSRADEVDNWADGKKPVNPVRSSNFGSSFREPDRWVRGVGFGEGNVERDRHSRPKLALDPPRGGAGAVVEVVKRTRPSPFGEARPREEVLTEKGLDWKKLDLEMEGRRSSGPASEQSSRPSSGQSSWSESSGGLSRPKLNPFGDAKPREVLLEQKGMDWRKIDLELEHRGVDRPEIEAEKNLKEEIDHLKKELEKEFVSHPNRESLEKFQEDQSSLRDLILGKERELELLTQELDDKVRFGQKAIERPGSGSGRVSGFPERRPPSQSGVFDNSRSMEVMGRPRSRGSGDMRTRHDRRAYHDGREIGYFGNRGMDRMEPKNIASKVNTSPFPGVQKWIKKVEGETRLEIDCNGAGVVVAAAETKTKLITSFTSSHQRA